MVKNIQTDVLIVGAGPAGIAAAMSILRYSTLKVVIVESSSFDNLKVGEQVSSSIFDILSYIGVTKQDFDKDCFLNGYGSLAAWGSENIVSRHSMFLSNGENFQLDREKFDLQLVKMAADAGIQIIPRSRCHEFNQNAEGHWKIKGKHETKGELFIESRYLIDATGRQSNICRQLDIKTVKYDQLVGIGTFVTFESEARMMQEIYMETVKEGWWYCSALPNSLMNITFFTDADIAKMLKLQKKENWNRLLSETKHIKQIIKNAVSNENLWTRNAFSQLIENHQHPNFFAIGDAAVSFDPISSMGIGFALTSGCSGAKALLDTDNGTKTAPMLYWDDLQHIFDQYLGLRNQFYAKELRWKELPFWSRRHL